MAEQGKTPIPKSQREIATGLNEPTIPGNDPNNVTKYFPSLADARANNQSDSIYTIPGKEYRIPQNINLILQEFESINRL